MMKFLLLACVLFGAYSFYNNRDIPQPPEDRNVVMYSLTTCGYCKQKSKELARHKIGHVEYFTDADDIRQDEFSEHIRNAGLPIRPYGMPTFVIYGEVMPDNPSIEEIKAAIARHRRS